MPIYEYGCGECGHEFEELVLSGESEPSECPSCGAEEIGRLVSNTSFHLKGSGWYVTDYKNGSTPESKPSDTADSSATASEDSTGATPDESAPASAESSDSTADDAA